MPASSEPRFDLSGGALCLDFINTLEDRPRSVQEHLHVAGDLIAWGEQTKVVTASEAAQLRRWASRRPKDAAAALDDAKALRESLFRVFHAALEGRTPPARDLARLNGVLAEGLAQLRVAVDGGGFGWRWEGRDAGLDVLKWAAARSAGDLLVSPERHDLRECGSDVCSWLFLDRSRTKRRRWCNMRTCGNRAKARRFYERHRQAGN